MPSAGCLCSLQSVEAALQAEQDPEEHWSWQSWPSLEPTSHSALMVAALSWSKFSSSPEKNPNQTKTTWCDLYWLCLQAHKNLWIRSDQGRTCLHDDWQYLDHIPVYLTTCSTRYLAKVRMRVKKVIWKGQKCWCNSVFLLFSGSLSEFSQHRLTYYTS